jgi:Domain of unknown function (DUF4440)
MAGSILCPTLLGLMILPCGRTVSAQAPPSTPETDREVLQRLEAEYLRAEIEDDATIAGSILADDYVGLRPDGSVSTKADVLSRLNLHERQRQPLQITATNMRQHLFGDTACVTYTKVYTKPGNQGVFSENVMHVLIRRNGIWRLELSTLLPQPPRS